jgi:hypothetical protein
MKHSTAIEVSTNGVDVLERPNVLNGESEFSADCIQSTKCQLSFAQQDKSSEDCIILNQKRTNSMIYPLHAVFYEMEYDEKDSDRLKCLIGKVNEIHHSGVLCATIDSGVVIVYFNGDIDKISAHCLNELVRKLACYSKYDSVMTMTSTTDVKHLIFKDHSSESTCSNREHASVLGITRSTF